MAVRRILSYYDKEDREILKLKSEPVYDIFSEETQNIIEDLKDTLINENEMWRHDSTRGGIVGLSAIQIGIPKQICVIKYDIYFLTIINPVVTKSRGEIIYRESCASCPDTYITTHRYQKVWADYYDEKNQLKHADQGGLFSVILQHEMDHFEGKCLVGEAALERMKEEENNEVIEETQEESKED